MLKIVSTNSPLVTNYTNNKTTSENMQPNRYIAISCQSTWASTQAVEANIWTKLVLLLQWIFALQNLSTMKISIIYNILSTQCGSEVFEKNFALGN